MIKRKVDFMNEKTLNLKLNDVYLKYHPNGKVIPGGIMDDGKYNLSNRKTMMLMKEVNDKSEKYNWSLPGLLSSIYKKECTYYRMWKNVSRWSICVENPDVSFEDINESSLYEGLKLFATTNLKKSGGVGESNYNEILEHAISNKDEWMEEVEILDPMIVICAGTFDIVKDIMETDGLIKTCKSGAQYYIYKDRIYLDFVHPAYQVSDKLMFAYFKETFRSLISSEEIKKLINLS